MQPASGLDGDDRLLLSGKPVHQPLQLIDSGAQNWPRQRLDQQPRRVRTQPYPALHLARIDRDHKPVDRQCPLKKITHQPSIPRSNVRKTLSLQGLETYQLD